MGTDTDVAYPWQDKGSNLLLVPYIRERVGDGCGDKPGKRSEKHLGQRGARAAYAANERTVKVARW